MCIHGLQYYTFLILVSMVHHPQVIYAQLTEVLCAARLLTIVNWELHVLSVVNYECVCAKSMIDSIFGVVDCRCHLLLI